MAQKIINLYDGDAPGLIQGHGLEEADISERNDGVVRLRNVSIPTLKVYEPQVNPTGAAVVICPGGGYYILAYNHEGENLGEWFAKRGVTAFVLKYRLPQGDMFSQKSIRPIQDLQQSFRIIRSRAQEFQIDPAKVGVMGFSAGGHLASTASTHFNQQFGEIVDPAADVRPSYSILIYPVTSFNDAYGHSGSRANLIGPDLKIDEIDFFSNEQHVTPRTPPTFIVHAFDDRVKIENSIAYARACNDHNVPVETHFYQKGGHGFGLTKKSNSTTDSWDLRLEEWLKMNNWME